MVTVTQNAIAIAIAILVSLLAMAGVNRVWPREKRRQYNDLIGWELSILGTTYAVILGFMLYAVWASFGEAELNVDLEADALVNVYNLADGLPETQHTQLEMLARSYADAVIHQDWPQMAWGEAPKQSSEVSKEMWETVMSVKAASPTEVNAQEHAMGELESLTQHRLTRILQSRKRLPALLWCVLVVGGILTIGSACTFGSQNAELETLHIFCLSLLISLALVAIADIHRPFYGLIHVKDYAFQRARQNMQSP